MRAQVEKELELPGVLATLETGIFAHVKKMGEILSHLQPAALSKQKDRAPLSLTLDDTLVTEGHQSPEGHQCPPQRRIVTTKDMAFKRSQENTSRLSLIIDDLIEFEREFYQWQTVPKSNSTERVSKLLAGLQTRKAKIETLIHRIQVLETETHLVIASDKLA